MKQYTEILLSYLRENPVQFTEGTTLLQQLYWCYTECNPLNSEALKTQFAAIYKSMRSYLKRILIEYLYKSVNYNF